MTYDEQRDRIRELLIEEDWEWAWILRREDEEADAYTARVLRKFLVFWPRVPGNHGVRKQLRDHIRWAEKQEVRRLLTH